MNRGIDVNRMLWTRFPGLLLALGAPLALAGPPAGPVGPPEPSPEAVGELLSRRCLACHDAVKASGDVDLSTRAAATRARPAGAALVPRHPERSRLFQLAAAGKMPPTGRLPATEIDLLRRWIAAGGAYPPERLRAVGTAELPHWSLQPVRRPPLPRSRFDRLARNPVDRFVFAALAERGLRPNPLAGRRALIRRVTVDLTGLPPTPEEMDSFLEDRSPGAYERVVDRLLASPAYGERWARHWLDVVRFGESHGYEQNHLRPNAWPYRDYVIRALNQDRPYPRFIAEQLAGDLVAADDPNAHVATGFLVAGVHDTVGIQTVEGTLQQRVNDLEDIVSTTADAFLGLTVGCARCHDHKFDPIPQRDYYRLAAVFSGVQHGERPLAGGTSETEAGTPSRPLRGHPPHVRPSIRFLEGQLADIDAAGRESVLRAQGVNPVPRPAVNARRNVDRFEPVAARFVRVTIEATRDGSQPCLDELEVYGPEGEENLALAARGSRATASSLLPGYPIHQIEHLNDGRWGNDRSWISDEPGRGWAQVELPGAETMARVVWSRDGGFPQRYVDRLPSAYRIEVSRDGKEWRRVASHADRAAASESIPFDRIQAALTNEQRERRARLAAELEEQRRRLTGEGGKTAYIGRFTAPGPIYLLRRGDVLQRGEQVTPGALSAIAGLDPDLGLSTDAPDPQRRLALARWIGSEHNPLTPRVIVNRVWQHHFGRGLVATPSDFGRNGEPPTHPALLDWLAWHFVQGSGSKSNSNSIPPDWSDPSDRSDPSDLTPEPRTPNPHRQPWSLKSLHRLLVTSYAYQQSAAPEPKALAADAGNRYLWRMPLRRLEAEAIRDAVLLTSGKLDRKMGGPGFPLFKYRVVNVASYEPLEEHGPETWRRSIYAQAARAIRDELLGGFDCPESSQRAPRRPSTTTPLQALTLLNGNFILQQASAMAERIEREAGTATPARVDRAFQLTFGRPPNEAERAGACQLVERHGLVTLCRALFNANEFLHY